MDKRSICVPILLTATLAVLVTGCSGRLFRPTSGPGIQLPSNAIVVGSDEKVQLNALTVKHGDYYCSNGAVLQCERLSFKLYCSCPVSWR